MLGNSLAKASLNWLSISGTRYSSKYPAGVSVFPSSVSVPHSFTLNAYGTEENKEIAVNALKTLGIEHIKDKEYTNLSGGERQLVFLARILCQQPDILILDEPTSHLDFGNQIKLLEIIDNLSKAGLSIIMSSHFPDHAFLSSNKVAILKDKKFIDFGTPEDVVTESNLKKAYSIDVKLIELDDKRKVCVPLKTNLELDL